MFFDNNILYNFLYKVRDAGITVPVVAGIMPVTNGKQINRICSLSGTMLPGRFKQIVDKFGENPADCKLDSPTAAYLRSVAERVVLGGEKWVEK